MAGVNAICVSVVSHCVSDFVSVAEVDPDCVAVYIPLMLVVGGVRDCVKVFHSGVRGTDGVGSVPCVSGSAVLGVEVADVFVGERWVPD